MKNQKLRRMLSLILAITMLLTGSMLVYAVDLSELFADSTAQLQLDEDCQILRYVDADALRASKHVARLKDQEQLDTYVFQNRDGTRTVYFMSAPVKYRDSSGNIREKDLTLVQKTGGYGVASSDMDMLLPATAADGIDIDYSGLSVTLIPENISFGVKAGTVDGEAYCYADCFGSGIDLVYTPILTGLKEDIVMERYFGKNQFSFLIESNGLKLYQRDGQYYLAGGENSDDKLWLGNLLIYDAMGKPGTGTMTVETVEERQQYRVTLTVDEAFLESEDTVFPVTVDPSVTVTISDETSVGAIEDATVYLNKPTLNAGNWTYNHIGKYDDNYGVGRTVYRLVGLKNNESYAAVSANDVTSVKLYVKEASGSAYATVNLYAMTSNSSWTETGITSTNYGSYDTSTLYASASMGYGYWGEFDITALAKAWKNGTRNIDCGLILVNPNETDSSVQKTVYSSEYGTSDYWPYVVATYYAPIALNQTSAEVNMSGTVQLSLTEGTAASWSSSNTAIATVTSSGLVTGVRAGTATITVTDAEGASASCTVRVKLPDDEYLISYRSTSYYLSPEEISYANDTPLEIKNRDTATPYGLGQFWKVEYRWDGYYTISALYNNSLKLRASSSTTTCLYSSTSVNACLWKIEWHSDGYSFTNKLYGTTLGIANSSAYSGVGVKSSSYSSDNYLVRWSLSSSTTPYGMLLLDSETGKQIDTTAGCTVYTGLNLSRTLDDLGVELQIYDNTNTSQAFTMSFANNYAQFNMANSAITSSEKGQTTATISRTINNKLYSVSFTMKILDSRPVHIRYDAQTMNSTWISYTTEVVDFIQKPFCEVAGIYYYLSGTPQSFTSTLVSQCSYGYSARCDDSCGSSCFDQHHKSLMLLSNEIRGTNTNDLFMYWRNSDPSVFCCSDQATCVDVASNMYAAVYNNWNVAFFLKCPETNDEHVKAAMCLSATHEIAHTLGLKEIYENAYGDKPDHDIDDGWHCVMERYESADVVNFYQQIKFDGNTAFCDYCLSKLQQIANSDE